MELVYCRAREGAWAELAIQTLDGEDATEIFNTDNSEWALCVATCASSGMSVITDNWDEFYLVPSIDLEYATTVQALGALERGGI